MTRQTWTAVVSAVLFVVSAAVLALVRVPYVTYAPGLTYDLIGSVNGAPVVEVTGASSFPTSGELRMTTVNITRSEAGVSLPEALFAWASADREVYPREAIYPPGVTFNDLSARDAQLMTGAQGDAVAAAVRAAGLDVRQVPMVQSVASSGPARDVLKPGDFILAVDGEATPSQAAVRAGIESHQVGEVVTFDILRDRVPLTLAVETAASKTQPGAPVVGVTLGLGYSYTPRVSFAIDPAVGGSSAGLMMSLAVFDRLTPDSLARDRVIAGTGTIDGLGSVGAVGGVQEKVAAAERSGATVFLVPYANCVDLVRPTSLRVVPVAHLDDAVAALDALADPASAHLVKGCS